MGESRTPAVACSLSVFWALYGVGCTERRGAGAVDLCKWKIVLCVSVCECPHLTVTVQLLVCGCVDVRSDGRGWLLWPRSPLDLVCLRRRCASTNISRPLTILLPTTIRARVLLVNLVKTFGNCRESVVALP